MVIDDHGGFLHGINAGDDPLIFNSIQRAGLDFVRFHFGLRTDDPVQELLRCHFQRKNAERHLISKADVFSDVEGQCGLSHRWSCSQDDQVGRRKAIDHLVQIDKMGRHSRNSWFIRALLLKFFLPFLKLFQIGNTRIRLDSGQNIFDQNDCVVIRCLTDVEKLLLGFVQNIMDILRVFQRRFFDFVRCMDHPS